MRNTKSNIEKLFDLSQRRKKKKISIVPHDQGDVDAFLSSFLFSKLLDFLRIPNEILIFDQGLSRDTYTILSKLGLERIDPYLTIQEDSRRNLFLLDHYKTLHKGQVIGCIDHHPTCEKIDYWIYDYRKSSATAYIVYQYMLAFKMPINANLMEMVGYAMLVDTCSFQSKKTVLEEAEKLPKLLQFYDLNFEKMKEDSYLYTDIEHLSVEDAIVNGLKYYTYPKGRVRTSYLQLKKNLEEKELLVYEETIRKQMNGILLWIFLVYALDEKKTYVHYI